MKKMSIAFLSAWFVILGGCTTPATNENFAKNDAVKGTFENGFWFTDGRDPASEATDKCTARVRAAGCTLSNNNAGRIEDNIQKCKQVKSKSGNTTLELFLLRQADKLVVIKTAGDRVSKPNCPATKYSIDVSGIDDFKIINNRVFMISRSGHVYFMYSDETVYELYNASGKPYTTVTDVKGTVGNADEVRLIGPGFEAQLGKDDIQNRINSGKVRKLEFFSTSTERSLFRDE